MAIGRLEGKMDGFLQTQIDQNLRLEKHEERIRTNETYISRVAGAFTLAAIVFTSIIAYFKSAFGTS